MEERIEDAKLRKSSIEMEAITLDNITGNGLGFSLRLILPFATMVKWFFLPLSVCVVDVKYTAPLVCTVVTGTVIKEIANIC